jgi:hypothetical protein
MGGSSRKLLNLKKIKKETQMDKEKVIHEFAKSAGQKVVCQFTKFKGKKRIDLRLFYDAGKDGEDWRPTNSGISLPREMVLDLKETIDKAAEEYKKELPGPEEKGESEEEEIPF